MSKTLYPETPEAVRLMDQFQTLDLLGDEMTRDTSVAKEVFFDKEYLTMSEFLAPIGAVLARSPVPGRGKLPSVGSLLSTIPDKRSREQDQRHKLQELIGQAAMTAAASLADFRRMETIKSFLARMA